MNKLVNAHLPCSSCGSSDALAEYENNNYCFSCGKSTYTGNKRPYMPLERRDYSDTHLHLPSNMTAEMGREADAWLLKHHVHPDLREKYNIGYMPRQNRIVLPVYSRDGDELKFYQTRALNKGEPKYLTIGSKEPLFWSKGNYTDNVIVIVEDILSAIRVGEHAQAVSLIGTSINMEQLLRLVSKPTILIVWLDGDGEGKRAAAKLRKKASLLAPNICNIVTERDPKCLFDNEIKRELALYTK